MAAKEKLVFSPSKVLCNQERVDKYARGERFYPVTMELDLTQKCTRNCPVCPYGAARSAGHSLPYKFLERLFGILGPHVPGVVLSGGESTSREDFPKIAALAKSCGFKEVSLITNGSFAA